MNSLLDKIGEWFKEALIGGITGNFQGMFEEVNAKAGEIAGQVGQTPEAFNSGVFSMIKSLSDTVILPIAGMILTFVLCYELIQLIIEKNNMHDFDTWIFFKWIFKTFAATYILTHTFDIVMGVFDLAQRAVNGSAGIISGSLNINLAMDGLQAQLESMEWYALMGLYMESAILSLCMKALSVCIFLIVYGRMLEIYLTTSVAAIPFATMVNREWGSIGQNYLKSLFAVAFQGFLIMVCIAIYSVLLNSTVFSDNIHTAIWGVLGYTVLLCFSLFKTGSLSKSVFSAH
ncbi:VirB6/TrbL-like conjugal transfer protein, CD1112 family [Oscillibacter sp. GMB15532]|uniref:VirB6/TrbL-like conjugal transfer protein, CD1112 family n=1 Tax=Oscillibacter sp. GMB15532 TaxID=3230022 RepID=UPI0034DE5E53